MRGVSAYVLEEGPAGIDLVVTAGWSLEAADVLQQGHANGLVLNYARGFSEPDLSFLDGGLGPRRLHILDRKIVDLTPIARLADTLEELSVQAAPDAELELGSLPRLRSVSGEWRLLRSTLGHVDDLRSVITRRFDEPDLHAFQDHYGLERLTIKEAPHLESFSGVAGLADLRSLSILLARSLRDVGDASDLRSLDRFELQDCNRITTLEDAEPLQNLRFLGVSNCGRIDSVTPIEKLVQLEILCAWGTTDIVDRDLSPLLRLPALREVRMRNRRGYVPTVTEVAASISSR
jgi:hypothetical protein